MHDELLSLQMCDVQGLGNLVNGDKDISKQKQNNIKEEDCGSKYICLIWVFWNTNLSLLAKIVHPDYVRLVSIILT